MAPIDPARGENTPYWHGPIRGTFPCLKRVGAVFWRFTAATPVARLGRHPYQAPRHSLRKADTDDRRRDPRRVPRCRGAARRAFHPLVGVARGARRATALAEPLPHAIHRSIQAVVSPAMGGVIAGHEMGRALGVEAMFLERPEGVFELRRGFRLAPGTHVLMMEDVVTTGLSSREAITANRHAGGEVVAAAALVDRSNGTADLGVPFFPLLRLDVPTYAPDALPPELAAIPAIKPGSRAA